MYTSLRHRFFQDGRFFFDKEAVMFGWYGLGAGTWIMVALFAWVAPAIVGYIVGKKKGKGGLGLILGLFLSWIGVIIVAVLSDDVKRDQEHKEMMAAVAGTKEVVKVKCPQCGALVDEGVKFCSGCGAPM